MLRAVVLAISLMASSAHAQSATADAPPADLAWITGQWTGSGAVFSAPSQATLMAAPALDGKFVELTYQFRTSGQRAFAFEGRGFYSLRDWRGHWFDSTGAARPLTGVLGDGELTSEWGDATTERGRTRYRRAADGALDVTDYVLRGDGEWHAFATHHFIRARAEATEVR